jgi:hypothetical protein
VNPSKKESRKNYAGGIQSLTRRQKLPQKYSLEDIRKFRASYLKAEKFLGGIRVQDSDH